MIRRIFGLAMVVWLTVAFSLQGSAVMRCGCSGEIYLAGWHELGCGAEVASEACDCCGVDGVVEMECSAECCWLVGVVPDFELVPGSVLETPHPSVADFVPDWGSVVEMVVERTEWVGVFEEPDPPGVSLRVQYSTFLI